jgi:hypothetical protein
MRNPLEPEGGGARLCLVLISRRTRNTFPPRGSYQAVMPFAALASTLAPRLSRTFTGSSRPP